ncbi:MAG: molecular chaperone DnaJ [Acholeplasmatales bacterium]|jgi:molecular chaperone DnaJ|nr:molecular chaperone DnaJ [Acholeplasmatales bacterium]
MAKRDYYEVLGVNKSSTTEDIKKAYRTNAKKYHPDNKETGNEERFKEINEAYEVLSQDNKRAQYDKYGFDGPQGFQGFSGGSGFDSFTDLSDIFSSFFGGGGRKEKNTQHSRTRGDDYEKRFPLTFMESVLGCHKTINIDCECDCDTCKGTGAKSNSDISTCSKCNGSGKIITVQNTLFGKVQQEMLCPDCRGSGKIIKAKCDSCRGTGRVTKKRTRDLEIPAGVSSDTQVRVQGLGGGGHLGGQDGDLFLRISVSPHNKFERSGKDIYLKLPISLTDAVLGTTLEVPTIYGDSKLVVPAGTKHGDTLIMRDKGTKDPNYQNNVGSQKVIVEVDIPSNLSKEEKELYLKLDALSSNKKKSSWEKFKKSF